jgi:feruloyl esterase
MYQGRVRSGRAWGDLVRAASPHRGPWPKLSVWHGGADATVKAINAEEILKQWRDVHGLPAQPALEGVVDGHPRQVWRNGECQDVIESFTIASMAHGTPLATGDGENAYGVAGPFLLDVGISSTYHIAKFWGLTGAAIRAPANEALRTEAHDVALVSPNGVVEFPTPQPQPDNCERPAPQPEAPRGAEWMGSSLAVDIQAVIDKALKAAGLRS